MRVFRDKSKLSPMYVPSRLPHRESKLRHLIEIFNSVIRNESPNVHVTIVGNPGTGKTVVAKSLAAYFNKMGGRGMRAVYVNCRLERTPGNIIRGIIAKISSSIPLRGLSIQEMLISALKEYVRKNSRMLLILDDADHIFTHYKDFIYMITRIGEYDPKLDIISLLMIAHSLNSFLALDAWTAGTLRRDVVQFSDYSYDQLVDIIEFRVNDAFYPEAVLKESIETCADISSKYGFNARYALELILRAGELAEMEGEPAVTPEHVRLARREIPPSFAIDEIKNLTLHEKLILLAVSRLMMQGNRSFIAMGELEQEYSIVCEDFNVTPVKHTWLWKLVNSLSQLGYVSSKVSSKGIRGKTTLIGLPSISAVHLERLLRRELNELRSEA